MNHKKTIDWMKLNQLIINPKRFQVIFNSKKKNTSPKGLKLQLNNTEIMPQPSAELVGVTIDSELNFD